MSEEPPAERITSAQPPAAGGSPGRQRLAWWSLGLVAFVALGLGTCLVLLRHREWTGGMRGSYPARDHDPRLTQIARTALPLMDALGRYRGDKGAFPASLAELQPYLAGAKVNTCQNSEVHDIDGWTYAPEDNGREYTLCRRLGWDPTLRYESDGGRWVFDPGTGNSEKQIQLNAAPPAPDKGKAR